MLVKMQRARTVIPHMIRTNLRSCFRNYVNSSDKKKICIVGSGPAGFYTAQHLLKNNITEVDIYEKLPVPFGLIRYGVAPDHPEIKACGASNDKILGIPGENSKNVLSARHFVGWYNGHPDHVNEEINLDTEVVTVIGHGNVALDVARILLRNLEDLKTTDITDYAFEALKKSQVRKVILAGRRGPLQVSFTIKELREMIKLPGCNVVMNPLDFRGVPELLSSLPRPRKRLLELLCDTALKNESRKEASKTWELKFFRRPKAIICDAHNRVEKIFFGVNKIKGNLEDAQIINTDDEEEVECGLVLRSVGYQSIPIDEYVPFDKTKHIIPNVEGRVKDRAGLYCSGWVKTGPTGVILSTMYGSYETAEKLLEDIKKGDVPSAVNGTKDNVLELLRTRGVKYTAFDSWLNIDKVEQERGKAKDKPREKIYHVKEMLQVGWNLWTGNSLDDE